MPRRAASPPSPDVCGTPDGGPEYNGQRSITTNTTEDAMPGSPLFNVTQGTLEDLRERTTGANRAHSTPSSTPATSRASPAKANELGHSPHHVSLPGFGRAGF